MIGDLSPARYVRAVRLEADGTVSQLFDQLQHTVWNDPECRKGFLAGCVEIPADLDVTVGDRLARKTMKVTKAAPVAALSLPTPTLFEARQQAYPPLTDFAEALTERELGNDTKWRAYMARVRQVREMPKE